MGHNPNGDDDDSNPMHRIGHGRGDDHVPRKTAAYSFVTPGRIVNVGDKKVEPTQPMEAVDDQPLTVKQVVNDLVAVNNAAWMALPAHVRDALLDRPNLFKLVAPKFEPRPGRDAPKLIYNGVVLTYDGGRWVLDKIML